MERCGGMWGPGAGMMQQHSMAQDMMQPEQVMMMQHK